MRFMRRALVMAALLLAASTPGFASDLQTRLDQLVSDAAQARTEAQAIRTLLKAKTPDLAQVRENIQTLRQHVDQLRQHADAIQPATYALNARQLAEVERLQKTAGVLQVFVTRKEQLLEQTDDRSRRTLRATADGVARRATLVERAVSVIRSSGN